MNIDPVATPSRAKPVGLALILITASLALMTGQMRAQVGPKHARSPTHETLMDSAGSKAGGLPTPLAFTSQQSTLLRQGAYDEDFGTRSFNHGYNPLVDAGFPVATMTARTAAADRWSSMADAFVSGNLDGGDGSGAWHFLGRASHLLQDMTAPMHVFGVDHAGLLGDPYALPACRFENFWQNSDLALRSILASIGSPLDSSTLDAKASERLDAFTLQRLYYRFSNSCPNRNSDDVRGWLEVVAWISYFRASYWGEVMLGNSGSSGAATTASTTSTTFSDGTVSPKPNVLHTMFNGHVQWIAGFTDNYYEITDRNGFTFRWMSWSDIDDWSACGRSWGNGQQDSSLRASGSEDDSRGARITGRFWFDTRELGKSSSGSLNRYCFPNYYPDGTPMTDHLHQYYGYQLYPLAVRYNAGLLGLANRRVTVKTADPTQANNFLWGRRDNFGNGPTFNTAFSGAHFYFAAKSPVTLTAPASNAVGRPFVRWLRDGSTFAGNTSRTITMNDSSLTIPARGVTYTAEYEPPDTASPTIGCTRQSSSLVFSWPTSAAGFVFEYATNLPATSWTTASPAPAIVNGLYVVTNPGTGPAKFYRLKKP